jgi:GR25 family glycosyltransferase involved in LPS biosynthesis
MAHKSLVNPSDFSWFLPMLINLDHRNDRLASALDEAKKIDLDLIRVKATDAHDISYIPDFVTKGALACWDSHRAAMRYLLDSSHDYAIVLEDDFQLVHQKQFQALVCDPSKFKDVDIFQFGFLVNDYKERFDLLFRNTENLLFSLLGKLDFRISGKTVTLKNRLRVRRKLNVPINWVADDFRAGAHAYLISRTAAQRILELNSPTFLTTDAFFSSLNSGRAFRIYRSRKSLIGQMDSPSSIKNWGAEVVAGN